MTILILLLCFALGGLCGWLVGDFGCGLRGIEAAAKDRWQG